MKQKICLSIIFIIFLLQLFVINAKSSDIKGASDTLAEYSGPVINSCTKILEIYDDAIVSMKVQSLDYKLLDDVMEQYDIIIDEYAKLKTGQTVNVSKQPLIETYSNKINQTQQELSKLQECIKNSDSEGIQKIMKSSKEIEFKYGYTNATGNFVSVSFSIIGIGVSTYQFYNTVMQYVDGKQTFLETSGELAPTVVNMIKDSATVYSVMSKKSFSNTFLKSITEGASGKLLLYYDVAKLPVLISSSYIDEATLAIFDNIRYTFEAKKTFYINLVVNMVKDYFERKKNNSFEIESFINSHAGNYLISYNKILSSIIREDSSHPFKEFYDENNKSFPDYIAMEIIVNTFTREFTDFINDQVLGQYELAVGDTEIVTWNIIKSAFMIKSDNIWDSGYQLLTHILKTDYNKIFKVVFATSVSHSINDSLYSIGKDAHANFDYVLIDIPKNAYYRKAVFELWKEGIVNGYYDNTFRADYKVTIGEFVKWASLLFFKNDKYGTGSSLTKYVTFLNNKDIDLSDTEISADNINIEITRKDVAKILLRILSNKITKVRVIRHKIQNKGLGFIFRGEDISPDETDWDFDSGTLRKLGLIHGYNHGKYFGPNLYISRGEIAKMLYNTLKYLEKNKQ